MRPDRGVLIRRGMDFIWHFGGIFRQLRVNVLFNEGLVTAPGEMNRKYGDEFRSFD